MAEQQVVERREATDAGTEEIRTRLTTQVAELWPRQGDWSEADYFALPDTNRLVELSEGALIMPPHPTETHQRVTLRLVLALQSFVEADDLGVVRFAPLPVRLWPGKIREPDILFVSRDHTDRIGEQFYGPPDLAVEVLSPGTQRVDRGVKMLEYARAGVNEYWLVDPEARSVEVYRLEEDVYTLLGQFGPGESARSRLLSGFEVSVGQVFAEAPA